MAVATGVIGVVTGGMALAAAGTTAVGASVTVAGMLNSADDIGTNANVESFMQQQCTTETGKNIVGGIKGVITTVNIGSDIKGVVSPKNTITKKVINAVDFFNSINNTANAFWNDNE